MNSFTGKTYAESITMLAEAWADREALVFGEARYSFRRIKAEIDSASGKLATLGLERGDKIAIWVPNRPEFLFTWLGAAQIGLVAVLLNTRLTLDEVEYQLRQSDSRALVVPGDGAFRDYLGEIARLCPSLRDGRPGAGIGGGVLPALDHLLVLDDSAHTFSGITFWHSITAGKADRLDYETDPDRPALIAYSSGTTALPKGAMLSHAVWRKAADHGERFLQTPDDKLYLCVPLFSILSTVNGVLTFWVGGSSVVLDDRFEAEKMLSTIERERCTAAYLLPVMITRALELANFADYDLSCLRTGIVLTTNPEVYRMAHDRLGMTQFITSYGMTETSSACTRTRADDPLALRLRSHGKPLPGIEVRVADPESGAVLAVGEVGEVQVRGYNLMLGYYNKPEETARAFTADGWYRTGDAGTLHDDGELRFLHRLSDGYKHKGFNVSTAEVEAALERHPTVERAAVLGLPDGRFGEVGVAFVIPRPQATPDPDVLVVFLKERLASFKLPARIFVVDVFPTTAGTGKVQKFKLREVARQRLCSAV